MRWTVKLLFLFAAAGLGVFLLLKLSSRSAPEINPALPTPALANPPPLRVEAGMNRTNRGREFLKRVYARDRDPAAATNTPALLQISTILESTDKDVDKARQLLALAPALPDEEKMEAADHAANLVTDADYDTLRGALVSPQTPEPVLDELLGDLLRRGNSLKLPTLVEIASQADHPRATEAHDLLELHLGEDHGADWQAWLKAARAHIAEHGE